MWPRERGFVLRSRSDPAWALAELAKLASTEHSEPSREDSPSTGNRERSRRRRTPHVGSTVIAPSETVSAFESHARALLPFWKTATSEISSSAFYAKLVRLARHLREPGDVARWLAPVRLERLTSATIRRDVAGLLDAHDLAWGLALLQEWTHARRGGRPPWSPLLEEICAELARGGSTSRAIASALAEEELSEALKRVSTPAKQSTWLELMRDSDLNDHIADALAAVSTMSESHVDDAFAKLAAAEMPTWVVVGATRACLMRSEALRDRVRGSVLHQEAVTRLRAIAEAPPRREDDWSLPYDGACRCRDCATLESFLVSPERDLDWPLNKERRRHIHGVLEDGALPVRHTTLRRGSPLTLQLRKEPVLFTREREHRDRAAALLAELRGPARAGRAAPSGGKRRAPRAVR
jgi:hypothetical protein